MYPLHAQLPNRSNNYGIEIKKEARSSGLTQDEKGKIKVSSEVCLEKCISSKYLVKMPIGKRISLEKEGRSAIGLSKYKDKVHESEDAKVSKKKGRTRNFTCHTFL